MKTILVTTLGALSALAMATGPAHGAEADADAEVLDCVNLSRIDHTHVVDNRNILFYMRGGNIYLNRLSHAVPGLDRNDGFMYRTRMGRLCRVDTVTVLERWGFGLTEGASGTLGDFVLVDEARAEALRNGDLEGPVE
jgi:hypothetical protein